MSHWTSLAEPFQKGAWFTSGIAEAGEISPDRPEKTNSSGDSPSPIGTKTSGRGAMAAKMHLCPVQRFM